MPQYTDSTGITWNYTESGGNATIGTGGGWREPGNATTLGASLSGAITIPSTVDGYPVTGIDGYAFRSCSGLTSIDLSGTQVASIGWQAFSQCTSLETIHNIPNSLTNIDRYAFYLTGLISIDLSGTQVTTLTGENFYGCSSLTSIDLPNSLISIGWHAFNSCSSLETIDLSGTQVTIIDYRAFSQCTSLTSIDLPNSLISIGTEAFRDCTSLTSIDLGNSVETIGDYAFRSCTSLTSIVIPDSVTTIEQYAFGAEWGPIGSSVIVYVKDVDPNDDYTMTTLQNTISGKIYSSNGTVTYEQWVAPNYAPNTPTLSDISCNENTPYTATVSATDDNGDILTFSLSGADSADFTLTGTSLSANAVFDFETKATYNITITASDGSLNTSASFTITVNNVVEAPELFNANVQGTELKTSADNLGITTQQLVAAGYTNQHLLDAGYLHSDICFVEGTPVNTDQDTVAIDKLDVSKHTIRGKPIVAVTKTISEEKHLVCIRKDALAKNVPSQDTLTTQNHTFFYNGNMVKAKHLVNKLDNVVLVKYDGSTLYNVLQDKHEKMVVNNLIAETLHPNHCIAQIYRYFAENKVSPEMQQKAIASLRKDQVSKNLTK
jgi:hypothetical protein